jgi:hypothetical protein
MAWRTEFKRVIMVGRLRERKVQLLGLLEMERRRESQKMFVAAKSKRGSPT